MIRMLQRNQFPRGFFVVALVEESDEVCTGEPEGEPYLEPEWLWNAMFAEPGPHAVTQADLPSAQKGVRVTVTVSVFSSDQCQS